MRKRETETGEGEGRGALVLFKKGRRVLKGKGV